MKTGDFVMNEGKSIEWTWRFMLKIIYGLGGDRTKDDSPIRESIGLQFFIQNPLVEKNPMGLPLYSEQFIDMIKRGAFDIDDYLIKGEALADYVDSINHKDKIYLHHRNDEGFVYTYPERLKDYITIDEYGEIEEIDQLDVICERLENNLGSNRAIANLYHAGFDHNAIDIPCLQLIQALVRDDTLYLSVFFRSNDIYGAFPSNMMFLSNIGLIIQERLNEQYPNIQFKGIDYHVTSAHIYQTDMDAVEKLLNIEGE